MKQFAHTCIPLADRDAWHDALDGVDYAFAHTWESCNAMHLTTGWPTFLYVQDAHGDRVVCPIAERAFGDSIDVVTPYGFGGFAGRGLGSSVLEGWREFAHGRGYVCGYLGLNPVFDEAVAWGEDQADSQNDVFLLDLRPTEDEMFRALSTNRKRNVSRWRKAGSPLVEDRDRLAAFFLDSYSTFMARQGAASVYDFARSTLESLLDLDNVVLVGAADGEEVSSVAVFAYTPAVGDYLFGLSTPAGVQQSAAVVWDRALRLRRLGVPLLNLGGGIQRGDGVAEFKQRFGARAAPLRRLRQVYDRDRFEQLCRTAGVDAGDWSSYFPPYRAP